MVRLFYGVIVPYQEVVDTVIREYFEETGYKLKKGENKYIKYLEYLQEEYGDYDLGIDEEEMQEDPYKYLINTSEFFQRLELAADLSIDPIGTGEYVFLGSDFEPNNEYGLLPPIKQIPPVIKKQVEDELHRLQFVEKPEILISGNRDIGESTEIDINKTERLP